MGPNAPTRLAFQHSTVRPAITEIELCAWLAQADPQHVLEYHRGFLALDRSRAGGRLREQDAIELSRVADRAWLAARLGLVLLLQRRNGPDDYSYLLVARPRSPTHPLSELLTTEVA
jgi:hypothetical protein